MTHVGRDNPRVKDVNVGGILTTSNPAEQRRLDGFLEQLEREKKKRLGNLEWNQRSFFIKQVFDHNNELRFVKASERPKYLEGFPPIDDDNEGEEEIHALKDPQDQHGVNPPPSSPISETQTGDLHSEVGSDAHSNQSDEIITEQGVTESPNDCRESIDTLAQVPVISPDSASAEPKSKVKFPVLKVRAMGLFAASLQQSERKVAESVKLPRTPDAERKSPRTIKISPGSPRVTKQFAPSAPVSPRVAFSTCSLSPDNRRQRHSSARLSVDVSDLPSVHRSRTAGEDLFSSPAVIRRQRSKSKPNLPIKESIWDKTMKQATSAESRELLFDKQLPAESVSDEDCNERVIRKLVRTLPTHLLLKTRERETETGSGSAGIGQMKKRMLEKCRNDNNQRTVEDPRFKSLTKSLTEVPNNNDEYLYW